MLSLTQASFFFPGHIGSEAAEHPRCASEVFGDKIWDMQVQDGCGLGPVAVVGRVPGTVICTTNNKNHIARDFHSVTAQQVIALYFQSGELSFTLPGTSLIFPLDLIYCYIAILF